MDLKIILANALIVVNHLPNTSILDLKYCALKV